MTSQVINLEEKLLDRGLSSYLCCPKCDADTSFIPVIQKNKTGKFISILVCVGPYCQGEDMIFPIVNGYVQEAESMEEDNDSPSAA